MIRVALQRGPVTRRAFDPNEQALIDLFEQVRVSVVYITTEAGEGSIA